MAVISLQGALSIFNNRMEVLKSFYDVFFHSDYTKFPNSICSHTRLLSTLQNWMRHHPVSVKCLEQCLLYMISQLSLGHQQVFCRSEVPKPFHEQIFRASMSTKNFSCYIF